MHLICYRNYILSINKYSVFVDALSVMVPKTYYTVLMHKSVTLSCKVTGNPPPSSVCWLKVTDCVKTRIIQSTNKHKYSQASRKGQSLTINDVDDNDAGGYKCIAGNDNSEVHSENIYVYVFGGNS